VVDADDFNAHGSGLIRHEFRGKKTFWPAVRISIFGSRASDGFASQSEATTVAVGLSPREGAQKPGVAERRLKGSTGSSFQASLSDAHPSPIILPWAQAHGYFTLSLRDLSDNAARRACTARILLA